jgi:hypothetical protein
MGKGRATGRGMLLPAAPAGKQRRLPFLVTWARCRPSDSLGRADVPKVGKSFNSTMTTARLNTTGGTVVTSSAEIPCTVLNEIVSLVLDDSYRSINRQAFPPWIRLCGVRFQTHKLQDGSKIRMGCDVPYVRTRVRQRTSAAGAVPTRSVAMPAVGVAARAMIVPSPQ